MCKIFLIFLWFWNGFLSVLMIKVEVVGMIDIFV